MKILCANWQAADEAELEREHYPDIEFILASSTTDKAAALDPAVCADGRCRHQLFADPQCRRRADSLPQGPDRGALRRRLRQHRHGRLGRAQYSGLQRAGLRHDRGRRPRHRR